MTGPAQSSTVADEVGGRLTSSGRQAALNAALPLLASYFAEAETWNLEVAAQLAVVPPTEATDQVLDDFVAGARLRASLAAADRLLQILGGVFAQPTFRYTQVSAESVGSIRGRLDLPRYGRQRGRIDVPRRYPVRLVERENATPENILAAYATMWIRRDLASTDRRILPASSPEQRELDRLEHALKRALGMPLLAGTQPHALNVWRRALLDDLLDQVQRRIDTGHVARAEPYVELVDWITRTRNGTPVADAGAQEWKFYGEAFDTKLFEIWCLAMLGRAISIKLGVVSAPARSLAARGTGPIYVWNVGAAKLRLHFQPSLAILSGGRAVWSYVDGGSLRGFPDLAVTADLVTGRGMALFDPKLRRRSAAPTEEIYKLLGYFGNLHHDQQPVGAIMYYSPGIAADYELTSASGGKIHAFGLDPDSDCSQLFAIAADLALGVTRVGDEALRLLREPVEGTEEERAEHGAGVRQAIAVEAMERAAEALPAGSLAPTRKHLAATLHTTWNRLSSKAQTMIVTAEYFANIAPDDADHSGPLLGLAAAVERLLRDAIFDPVAVASPGVIPSGQTLGACLTLLDQALRDRRDAEPQALRRFLRAHPAIDQQQLRAILPAARTMNRDYRIPAAHAELVSASTWTAGRDAILHPTYGVLPRLVQALRLT